MVEPDEAEVLVNGAHAGTVDDFDGFSERLYLQAGEYDIEVRLGGYRTFRERVLITSGRTFKLIHDMERLPTGTIDGD